jgi:hypothetical protein
MPTCRGEVHEVSESGPMQRDAGSTSPRREISEPRCACAIRSGLGGRSCTSVNRACLTPGRQGGGSGSGNRRGGRADARFGDLTAGVQEAWGPMLDPGRDRRYRFVAHRDIAIGEGARPSLTCALHPPVQCRSDSPAGPPRERSTSSRRSRVGAASTPWSPARDRRNRRVP